MIQVHLENFQIYRDESKYTAVQSYCIINKPLTRDWMQMELVVGSSQCVVIRMDLNVRELLH